MSKEVVLYDLKSREPYRSFSSNVWKTRLALNYKKIAYRTEWIAFIHLQETLKSLYASITERILAVMLLKLQLITLNSGLKPNAPGSWTEYSVPAIQFPDGTYMMDSIAIAHQLEAMSPEPPLRLDQGLQEEMQAAVASLFIPILLYLACISIKNIVGPEDIQWFREDRAKRLGMTVQQLEKAENPDYYYALARPGFEECKKVLTIHKQDKGPFILGSVPCYADFYLVGKMLMLRHIGSEHIGRFLKKVELRLDHCLKHVRDGR